MTGTVAHPMTINFVQRHSQTVQILRITKYNNSGSVFACPVSPADERTYQIHLRVNVNAGNQRSCITF